MKAKAVGLATCLCCGHCRCFFVPFSSHSAFSVWCCLSCPAARLACLGLPGVGVFGSA
jgi:hypothetical protein